MSEAIDIIDLGDVDNQSFNQALEFIDNKQFPVTRGPASFTDGRGSQKNMFSSIEEFRESVPKDHWLLGVIPWKLFSVEYIQVKEDTEFLTKVCPIIDKVHQVVGEIMLSDDIGMAFAKKAGRQLRID